MTEANDRYSIILLGVAVSERWLNPRTILESWIDEVYGRHPEKIVAVQWILDNERVTLETTDNHEIIAHLSESDGVLFRLTFPDIHLRIAKV